MERHWCERGDGKKKKKNKNVKGVCRPAHLDGVKTLLKIKKKKKKCRTKLRHMLY